MERSRADNKTIRVAVVGAGITGAVAASELTKLANNDHKDSKVNISLHDNLQVVVFDQGNRGPGGRASHRSVSATQQVLADDWEDMQDYQQHNNDSQGDSNKKTLQFDHGCQFFRADSPSMRYLLESWLMKGWVQPWNARFGCLTTNDGDKESDSTTGFFGIPSSSLSKEEMTDDPSMFNDTVYTGVGGMHLLPRRILLEECSRDPTPPNSCDQSESPLVVHRGTRVQRVFRDSDAGKWNLETIGGPAAYHDTKINDKNEDEESPTTIHGNFDAVLFTDISSSMDGWHRASAGIPDSFREKLPNKIRIPLFSCMISLGHPIRQWLPYDAFSTSGKDTLWFAAVSQSKPGMYHNEDTSSPECWTLISTPSFAIQEIQSTTMRDTETGAFKPQENSYLNSIPGPALANAFLETIRPFVPPNEMMPEIVYLQAQRWGSALPAPESMVKSTIDICGTTYAKELKNLSMVFPRPPTCKEDDFVAEDALGLYYAGDFCSHRNPGLEAAALSGLEVARHMWAHLCGLSRSQQ